jgi:hypothetical protein
MSSRLGGQANPWLLRDWHLWTGTTLTPWKVSTLVTDGIGLAAIRYSWQVSTTGHGVDSNESKQAASASSHVPFPLGAGASAKKYRILAIIHNGLSLSVSSQLELGAVGI